MGLFHQRERERLETRSNNLVRQTNLGWFAQQEIKPTSWLRTQFGVRLDNFWYDVDQIGDPGSVSNPISGNGSASIVNPKLNFIFTPFKDTDAVKGTNLFLNFGGGFHSNDARVFVQDQDEKDPAVLGWRDWRSRSRLFDRLDLTLPYWRSYLESELVFVGDEGTFEPSGSQPPAWRRKRVTLRHFAVADVRSRSFVYLGRIHQRRQSSPRAALSCVQRLHRASRFRRSGSLTNAPCRPPLRHRRRQHSDALVYDHFRSVS